MKKIYNKKEFLDLYNYKELYMKKISILSMMVMLVAPAMATESAVSQAVVDTANTTVAVEQLVKTSNPKIKFPHGLQLGIGVSPTSGLNGFIGYNNKNFNSFWAKRFGFRFDFASYSPIKNRLNRKINESIGEKGIEIEDNLSIEDVSLNAKHYGALVDFYPFGNTWFLGGMRLSGGYVKGKLDLDAKIHGKNIGGDIEFELNGNKYYYTGGEMRGTASGDWEYKGPYAGLGFDLGLLWGFKIYMDAGVVFADKTASIGLDVPLTGLVDANGNSVEGNETLTNLFNTNKDAEIRKAQDEMDKYPYYPLIKLGFMYRF